MIDIQKLHIQDFIDVRGKGKVQIIDIDSKGKINPFRHYAVLVRDKNNKQFWVTQEQIIKDYTDDKRNNEIPVINGEIGLWRKRFITENNKQLNNINNMKKKIGDYIKYNPKQLYHINGDKMKLVKSLEGKIVKIHSNGYYVVADGIKFFVPLKYVLNETTKFTIGTLKQLIKEEYRKLNESEWDSRINEIIELIEELHYETAQRIGNEKGKRKILDYHIDNIIKNLGSLKNFINKI